MMSAMMIGLEVAPVIPRATAVEMILGSTESDQTLVPIEASCLMDMTGGLLRGRGARATFSARHCTRSGRQHPALRTPTRRIDAAAVVPALDAPPVAPPPPIAHAPAHPCRRQKRRHQREGP